MKILLVEDDKVTADTLVAALKDYYVVEVAKNGTEGEYKAQVYDYATIILDYALPDFDGIQLCKNLRNDGLHTPILMLTGNAEVVNKVKALNCGADDYITKPVDIDELRARIEAVIRRTVPKLSTSKLIIDDLVLDTAKREAIRDGRKLTLKRKEFELLEYLMRNAGRVITRSMILDHIWESAFESDTNVIDVHIKYLRDQVDRDFKKKLIKTIHGYGYKFEI